MKSANIPEVRLGIVAVSRDCFPIALSTQRLSLIHILMVRLSGVTAHSMASTSTPAAAARRSASPKAGWVASLGAKSTMPLICKTKQTVASYPSARQRTSSSRCLIPRRVGASGKRAWPFSSRVTPFTSANPFRSPASQ